MCLSPCALLEGWQLPFKAKICVQMLTSDMQVQGPAILSQ